MCWTTTGGSRPRSISPDPFHATGSSFVVLVTTDEEATMMQDDRWWRWRMVEPDAEFVRTSKRGRKGRSPLRHAQPVPMDDLPLQRWRWS